MHNRQSFARRTNRNLKVLAFILPCCLMMPSVPGFSNALSRLAITDTTLSPRQLKAYEGYYKFQFQQGTDSYIHIKATEKGLVLQQMWDGKEIAFTPQSALEFINDDGNFPLKFTKGGNGAITQVLAFNRDLWTKTNDYKPEVVKEVHLDPHRLQALAGKYKLESQQSEAAYIQIRATAEGLVLKQTWDGKEFPFVAQSDVDFYCKAAQFPLKFTRDNSGTAVQVLAFDRDVWKKVKE